METLLVSKLHNEREKEPEMRQEPALSLGLAWKILLCCSRDCEQKCICEEFKSGSD
ncbi:hypothetical protein T4D_13433 [Trichinella pseudospiralis]|uniref:Uncharacterized protein n=1 Tax=Trichinella pseudospiralis TaxID=6337 RepID=A0A0V1FAF1_TRIPS|nr:hypothetical protein T4D_13433 [Trichinella pseudospiralis]